MIIAAAALGRRIALSADKAYDMADSADAAYGCNTLALPSPTDVYA